MPSDPNNEIEPVVTLPDIYRSKKYKGQPYAFYSYKHYEVYPGDIFFGIYKGKIAFARTGKKSTFEPFSLVDVFEGREKLPFDNNFECSLKELPEKGGEETKKEDDPLKDFKKHMLQCFETGLLKLDGPDFLEETEVRKSFIKKPTNLKLGFFHKGSREGKKFTLPSELLNEPTIILTDNEKKFMEPYFEINIPFKWYREGENELIKEGDDKIIFRKIFSMNDFYNLLEEGEPELLLDSNSVKTKVSHPYHYIPKEWINGTYESSQGERYKMQYLFSFFGEQFIHNIGMSIVNLKQQMMPYYQKYRSLPIPTGLRREDIQFLASKWFVQDVRDGLYYYLQPGNMNPDGSCFCLDIKWFSLFFDRVKRYGKKKVCDPDTFKFRSSKDKHYFQMFCLDEKDLQFAFDEAIDCQYFREFYDKMDHRFNPFYEEERKAQEERRKQLAKDFEKFIEQEENQSK